MKNNAEAKLKMVTDKVARLEAELQAAIEKMASLEEQVERCKIQLVNADKLIGGLGGEAKNWEEEACLALLLPLQNPSLQNGDCLHVYLSPRLQPLLVFFSPVSVPENVGVVPMLRREIVFFGNRCGG